MQLGTLVKCNVGVRKRHFKNVTLKIDKLVAKGLVWWLQNRTTYFRWSKITKFI